MQTDVIQTEIHDLILDAAERLLFHYGYQKMTMQDLAREAGIGVGTTYLHFRGKADVAVGVVERANAQVLDRLREIAAADLPVEERLRQMLVARVLLRYEGARKAKHKLDEMIAAVKAALRDGQRTWKWVEEEPAIFAGVLVEGERSGRFSWAADAGGADGVAEMLLLASRSMMPDQLCGPDFEDPDAVRGRATRLAALLIRAVRSDIGSAT